MAQHQHKFAVGQVVNFLPASADGNVRRGQVRDPTPAPE